MTDHLDHRTDIHDELAHALRLQGVPVSMVSLPHLSGTAVDMNAPAEPSTAGRHRRDTDTSAITHHLDIGHAADISSVLVEIREALAALAEVVPAYGTLTVSAKAEVVTLLSTVAQAIDRIDAERSTMVAVDSIIDSFEGR